MPVVTIDYNDLISLLGKELTKEEFIEKVPMMGASYEGSEGNIVNVEFFPNRPDLYSVEGAARALRGFLGIETGLPRYKVAQSEVELLVDSSVEEVRPYCVGGLVKNIAMSDYLVRSIVDLQEKLHVTIGRKRKKVAIGIHDFDKVIPPFIYKAVLPRSLRFIPLGIDREMDLQEILDNHEKGIEYRHILQGKERYPIILDSHGVVLSFPPVINGITTALTESTRNIFIDVTGTDFEAVSRALNIVTTALEDRGGEIHSVKLRYPHEDLETPDLAPRTRELSVEAANSLLGIRLSPQEAAFCLEKMRHGVEVKEGRIIVNTPAYRTDVLHEVDLIEDVAIGYGYERFALSLPIFMTTGETLKLNDFTEVVRDIMVGYGFQEVSTLSLLSPNEPFVSEEKEMEVLNPVSQDLSVLRSSLIPSLLNTFKLNKHRDLPQKIFEVGDAVVEGKNERRLGVAIIHSKASFTEIKSIVQGVVRDLGYTMEVAPRENVNFISGRCASILVQDQEVGYFGEAHPRVIVSYGLSYPVVASEMDLKEFIPK